MTRPRSIRSLLRAAIAPTIALLIIANFAGYALIGPNGLLAWDDYRRLRAERAEQLATLEAERAQLANRVALLDPSGVDPDYADELIRRETGMVGDDEFVIPVE
ncbi:MAG: septum formation initiator family protein [Sphingomonadaceae bacterium]|nr:septum formation initiator family protein [Sphingomonadaceae bacterium]